MNGLLGASSTAALRVPQPPPPAVPANIAPTGSSLRQALEALFCELGELASERGALHDALLSLGFLGDDLPSDASTSDKVSPTMHPLLAVIAEAANQVRLEKLALYRMRGRLPL